MDIKTELIHYLDHVLIDFDENGPEPDVCNVLNRITAMENGDPDPEASFDHV